MAQSTVEMVMTRPGDHTALVVAPRACRLGTARGALWGRVDDVDAPQVRDVVGAQDGERVRPQNWDVEAEVRLRNAQEGVLDDVGGESALLEVSRDRLRRLERGQPGIARLNLTRRVGARSEERRVGKERRCGWARVC